MTPNTSAAMAAQQRRKSQERMRRLLSTEQAGGPNRQGDEQEAESYRGRPGRPVEGCREALDDAEQHGGNQRAGQAAEPAEHADGEDAADIFTPDRRLDRLDHDQ